jgi:hypothetical protein
MKRLNSNKLTGEFLARGGVWSKDICSAQNFPDLQSAIGAQQEAKVENVEIVLIPQETVDNFDETLPLGRKRR